MSQLLSLPLLHYSASASLTPKFVPQLDFSPKPSGLWLSVGESWKHWCEEENYCLARLKNVFRVTLKSSANIALIQSEQELQSFHFQWSEPVLTLDQRWPNWRSIAQRFDGILITEYFWNCRLDRPSSNWYYGWDCASGCIWNPIAIESVCHRSGNAPLRRSEAP